MISCSEYFEIPLHKYPPKKDETNFKIIESVLAENELVLW